MISLTVNKKAYSVDADPEMPLLWAIRDLIGLTGTKYGCGVAQCGACTVHLNGEAVRSCVTRLKKAEGQQVTTIEGLSAVMIIPCNWHGTKPMYRNAAIAIQGS